MDPFLVEPQFVGMAPGVILQIMITSPSARMLGKCSTSNILHLLKQKFIGLAREVCACGGRYEMTHTLFIGEFQQRKREKILVDLSSKGALSPTPNSQPVFQIILPHSTSVVGDN